MGNLRAVICAGERATDQALDLRYRARVMHRLLSSALALVLVATGAFATRTDASGARTFLTDALGSTVALTDPAGAITTSYTYEPYGKTTVTGTASTNSQQFTGRETDATGLYYFRARHYHPTFGRFISEDPAGFAAGDPNLYRYVAASPTNATDPDGRWIESAIDVGFIAADLWLIATGTRKQQQEAWASLGLDVMGLLLPGVAGLGHLDDVARLADGVRGVDGASPLIKAGSSGGETAGRAFPPSVRREALEANPSTCVYCRMETDNPQVDHAIPRARDGNATIPNAQTTCRHCNASKGARDFPVTPPNGYRGPWPPPWWPRG
jgi:RHS repeat-associated protein